MSDSDEPLPLESCTLPGTITVTPRALEVAEQFGSALPSGTWIIAFFWCEGRGVRASKDAPLVDLGPGIEVTAYRPDELPKEAIYRSGSFRYAVLMRKDVVDRHPDRTLDLNEKGEVVLR